MKKFTHTIMTMALVWFGLQTTYAQNVVFNDTNFKNALLSNVSINTNADGEISISEAQSFTGSIDIDNEGITDLTGIEEFINITELDVRLNDLTSFDISALTDLQVLNCSAQNTGLTSLDVTSNTSLEELDVSWNSISAIDVSNNTSLTYLDVGKNNLTSIDVSTLTDLDWFYIYDNDLNAIDVSNNTQLTRLYVGQNNISTLDVNNNTELLDFRANQNNINSIDISALTKVTTVHLDNNNLTTIDVSNNPDLIILNLHNNTLGSIDLSNNVDLQEINLTGCGLDEIDVSNNPLLEVFRISSNSVTSLNLLNNTSLKEIQATNNDLTHLDISHISGLTKITVVNNDLHFLNVANGNNTNFVWYYFTGNPNLTCIMVDDVAYSDANWSTEKDAGASFSTDCGIYIPDANFKAFLIADDAIDSNMDDEIQVSEAVAYTATIDVSDLSISDLTGIEAFANITELQAQQNNLTLVDVSQNTKLVKLWLTNNDITSIDLSKNTVLEDLRVDQNSNLTELDISANNQLTVLHAYSCNYQNLDVSNNSLLEGLFIYNNPLSTIDISGLTHLDDLRIGTTNITTLDLSNSPDLRFLRASNMGLTVLNIANNLSLVQLYIQTNNLTGSLDLSSFPDLTAVRIEENDFTDVDLRNGNNAAITNFNATSNPNLTCISVDDIAYAESNFTNIDSQTNFSTDCSNVENDITAFSFTEQTSAASIDAAIHSIAIEVTFGTDLSTLVPTFTVSSGATADPASGVAQDFSSAFTYTITAENPTAIQEWTVNVTEENVAPTDISINNSSIDENNGANAVVGSLTTTDDNTSDTHTYALVAGTGDTDNASFDISGSSLIALESFDFETKSSYSVRIQTDDGNGGVFEKEFSISVNDVSGVGQTITFEALADKTVADVDFELMATASSGLDVSYVSSDESVATISGTTVTIVGAGSTTITASQAGDGDYVAATNVEQTLTVHKLSQTITFDVLADKTVADAAFELMATASSGLDVSYASSDESIATISGTTVTIVGAGTTTITASQAGDGDYAAATSVEQTLTVHKLSQTITFESIDNQLMEDETLNLEATASSGLDVSYTIVSGPATVSGSVITFTGLGDVFVEAAQNGDDTYLAAEAVEQSFEIITVTGLTENLSGGTIHIYPNPVIKTLFITNQEAIQETQVIDMSGSVVIRKRGNSHELDVSQLLQGNYIVRVITSTGIISNQIIKK